MTIITREVSTAVALSDGSSVYVQLSEIIFYERTGLTSAVDTLGPADGPGLARPGTAEVLVDLEDGPTEVVDLPGPVLLLPEPGHGLEVGELGEEDPELGQMTGGEQLAGVPGQDHVDEELVRAAVAAARVVRTSGGQSFLFPVPLLAGGPGQTRMVSGVSGGGLVVGLGHGDGPGPWPHQCPQHQGQVLDLRMGRGQGRGEGREDGGDPR